MLAGVADKDTQEKLATECIENGWTVRELEKLSPLWKQIKS